MNKMIIITLKLNDAILTSIMVDYITAILQICIQITLGPVFRNCRRRSIVYYYKLTISMPA